MKTYIRDLKFDEVIERIKKGEIIIDEETGDIIKYYDGMICKFYKDGTYIIGYCISSDPVFPYYFETKEPFSLEVDKFYRTKDNKKVYIYEKNRGYSFGVVLGHGVCSWHNNTKEVCYKDKNDSLKIVGKWEE